VQNKEFNSCCSIQPTGEIKMKKNYNSDDLADELSVIGYADLALDAGLDTHDDVVLDFVYSGEKFSIEFQKGDSNHLGETDDWGVAENDSNKEAFMELADKLVENGVITEREEAYDLVTDVVEPYLVAELDAELTAKMDANFEKAKEDSIDKAKFTESELSIIKEVADTCVDRVVVLSEHIRSDGSCTSPSDNEVAAVLNKGQRKYHPGHCDARWRRDFSTTHRPCGRLCAKPQTRCISELWIG
jgi:predicted DNA binding protein